MRQVSPCVPPPSSGAPTPAAGTQSPRSAPSSPQRVPSQRSVHGNNIDPLMGSVGSRSSLASTLAHPQNFVFGCSLLCSMLYHILPNVLSLVPFKVPQPPTLPFEDTPPIDADYLQQLKVRINGRSATRALFRSSVTM